MRSSRARHYWTETIPLVRPQENGSHLVEILPFTEMLLRHIDFLRMSLDTEKECWNTNTDAVQLDTFCGIIIYRTTSVKITATNEKQQGINSVFLISGDLFRRDQSIQHTQLKLKIVFFSMLLLHDQFVINFFVVVNFPLI